MNFLSDCDFNYRIYSRISREILDEILTLDWRFDLYAGHKTTQFLRSETDVKLKISKKLTSHQPNWMLPAKLLIKKTLIKWRVIKKFSFTAKFYHILFKSVRFLSKSNSFKFHSTYTRASNYRQNSDSKLTIRLIRGSTYTRVHTVVRIGQVNLQKPNNFLSNKCC